MVVQVKNWWFQTCRLCAVIQQIMRVVVSIFIILLSIYGSYQLHDWWQDASPAVAFGGGEITPLEVRPGERLIAHLNVNKLRNCDGEVRRIVAGDCGYHVVSEVKSTLVEGFNGQLTYAFQLPFEAIPGQCAFRVYARYWCNPFDLILNRQVFESPAIPFTVKGWRE